jgi:hypothetical protein
MRRRPSSSCAACSRHPRRRSGCAEFGIWKGATSIEIASLLGDAGELHLFDYHDNVDGVMRDLAERGVTNAVGWGSSYRYLDSYNWSLKRLMEECGTEPFFDYAYLDGAHTWAIDALAFFLCDALLKPGGHLDFDDYRWRLRGSSLDPSRVPLTAQLYTDEQIDDQQVKAILELLVRPSGRYDEVVRDRIFRKVEADPDAGRRLLAPYAVGAARASTSSGPSP